MRHAVLALALLTVAALPESGRSGRQTQEASAVAEVSGLEETRRSAMVAADAKVLEGVVAPDARYIHSTGLIQNRDEFLAMLEAGEVRYLSFTLDEVEYRAYGETVVGTGTQSMEVMSAGRPLRLHSRFTVVYTTVDGKRRMVAYQATALAAPPPAR